MDALGVLSVPLPSPNYFGYFGGFVPEHTSSYIPASYVKFIESGGGRVFHIPYDVGHEMLRSFLDFADGVLLPGGGGFDEHSNVLYFRAMKYITHYVIEQNYQGFYYPLWGTCLGMQLICSSLSSEGEDILREFDSENISLSLRFTDGIFKSRLFDSKRPSSRRIRQILQFEKSAINNHRLGISPTAFLRDELLSNFARVLATSTDRKGDPFVAIFEGKKIPIYGTQFHPEKISYEWYSLEAIPHDNKSRDAMQYFGNFIVDEARKHSSQIFQLLHDSSNSEEERTGIIKKFPLRHYRNETILLIYNYFPLYTGRNPSSVFEQVYFFDRK